MNDYLNKIISSACGRILPKRARRRTRLQTTHFRIASPRLPQEFNGLRIAHLSDLHNKKYGEGDILLYKRIVFERPDIVVMTGDMISHGCENREDFIKMVNMLCRRFPVYYVNGNHEYSDMGKELFDKTAKELSNAGAICLDNSSVTLKKGNAQIKICGLSYPARFYRGVRQYKQNWSAFALEDMLRYCGEKGEDYTILLAHNPLDFDVHAEWGADLSFGGHIHGGLIRLPIVKGIISPERRLFPKYKEGVYKKGISRLVVSRGLGRIRFFNPPELVIAELHKSR